MRVSVRRAHCLIACGARARACVCVCVCGPPCRYVSPNVPAPVVVAVAAVAAPAEGEAPAEAPAAAEPVDPNVAAAATLAVMAPGAVAAAAQRPVTGCRGVGGIVTRAPLCVARARAVLLELVGEALKPVNPKAQRKVRIHAGARCCCCCCCDGGGGTA